jgi:hypothetical protein
MTSVTPEQQAFLDARRSYYELREQHIRRTQVITGRLYLGRGLRRLVAWAWLFSPMALVLVSIGWLDVRASQANVLGMIVGGTALVLIAATTPRPQRPSKTLVRGLGIAVFGAAILANQAAATLLGGLLSICGFAVIVTTSIWLVWGRLRAIFRTPKPIELSPIEQKSAA